LIRISILFPLTLLVSTDGAGYALSSAPKSFDANAFKGLVPNDLLTTAILIRRVNETPVYKYGRNFETHIPL
jgi:Ni/Fe-hydrogenase subunit HybB-like protein